ncbi:MAG TPA: flagellar export chaperone FliS [Clostridiales bacterium]|nr:flagellar export chaperone FliS [Clostridiales bacterium]
MLANPYQEYKKQAVLTMTQGEMVVKLYDECLKMLNAGIVYIQDKNIEMCNKSLKKAHEILNYMSSILNRDYEISNELSALYEYYVRQIITANTKKDIEPLEEIIPMITDLRNSFHEADKQLRMK